MKTGKRAKKYSMMDEYLQEALLSPHPRCIHRVSALWKYACHASHEMGRRPAQRRAKGASSTVLYSSTRLRWPLVSPCPLQTGGTFRRARRRVEIGVLSAPAHRAIRLPRATLPRRESPRRHRRRLPRHHRCVAIHTRALTAQACSSTARRWSCSSGRASRSSSTPS